MLVEGDTRSDLGGKSNVVQILALNLRGFLGDVFHKDASYVT